MMEENGSDNIVFSLLYGISLIRVYGQNRREGYREEGLSAPLRMEMNELVRDICMTLHISRATLYRYINTGGGNA